MNLNKNEMIIERKLITPSLAKELLESNLTNRRLRREVVVVYSKDIKAGKWKQDTGELIKISKENVLLDGQHRLHAVIEANIPVFFHIARDVDDSVFDVLDTGKMRGGSDTLQVQGVKNYSRVSAIITGYNALKAGHSNFKLSKGSYGKMTNQDILKLHNERPEFWQETAKKSDSYYNHFSKIISYSTIGSYYSFFYDLSPSNTELFFDQLCINTVFPKQSAIIALSKKLVDDRLSNKKMTQSYRSAYIIKAWNAFRTGRDIKILNFNPEKEDYPKAL
jgi:hypothetical protein